MNWKIGFISLIIVAGGVISFSMLNSPETENNPEDEPGFETVDAETSLQLAAAGESDGQITVTVENIGEVSFNNSRITVMHSGESYSCGNGKLIPGNTVNCETEIDFPAEGESKRLILQHEGRGIGEYVCNSDGGTDC